MELSEQQVRDLLDAAPDALIIVDRTGRVVFVNSQTHDLFGYRQDELIGRGVETLLPARFRNAHAEYRQAFLENPRRRAMGGGVELFALRADGSEFPVEISLSPVGRGAEMLVASAVRDVTAHKQLERALHNAKEEAERASRAKSRFLAAASHDLRQPLQTLSLLNGVLRKTAAGASVCQIADSQGEALRGMADLVNALLDIGKLESGAVKPDIDDCSVRRIFQRMRNHFEQQAEQKGLKLIVDECDDTAHTDPGLLEQIIQNLVANAIRYTTQGLVRLRCLCEATRVRIEVLDTGVGIPAEELELIFDEFHQVHRPAAARGEGFGLGLAIVKQLAALLDAEIEVDSTPGKGSRFAVTVPRAAASPLTPRQCAVAPATRGAAGRGTILIIDDERAVLEATRLLLGIEGFDVYAAPSLHDATAWLRTAQSDPDLVICDYHLSGVATGVDAIVQLRTLLGPSLPAILITGDTSTGMKSTETVAHCRTLTKPVDVDAMLALIHHLLA